MTQEPKKQAEVKKPAVAVDDDPPMGEGEDDFPKKKKFGLGNVDAQGIIVTLIVALIAVFMMNTFIVPVPGMGKYKADITRLENDLVAEREARANVENVATAKLNTAIQNFTTQTTNQLGSYVTKPSIDSLQGEINSINGRINGINESVNKLDFNKAITDINGKIDGINTEITKLNTTTSGLSTSINGINLKSLQDQITALQTSVNTLKNQQTNANVSVNSTVTSVSLNNALAVSVPVQIINTSAVAVVVPLKLELTTATAGITVSNVSMNRISSSVITNPNVTFTTEITIEANSTVNLSPVVTLTFTGTSPNVWNVVWKIQQNV